MDRDQWTAVDQYFGGLLFPGDDALSGAVQTSEAAGLPPIAVAPNEGKLLHLLALSVKARRVLEVGTLGGYSTIWLARAVGPEGRVVTIEANARHADVAQSNIAAAGLSDRVEVLLGTGLSVLPTLSGPFDLSFIDADKANIPDYFGHALRMSRAGSLIVVDNVVRNGRVVDAASADADIQGIRRFAEMLAKDTRVSSTVIQTVGARGYDGFSLSLVL